MLKAFNPFAERMIIKEKENFFGRKKEIKEIFGTLKMNASCSLIGTRKIGKSSLLYYITNKDVMQTYDISPDEYLLIYNDYSALRSEEEFYSTLIGAIKGEKPNFRGSNKMELQDILMDTIDSINSKGKKIVFILDEFEKIMENLKDESGLEFLRGLATTKQVMYITSSQNGLWEISNKRRFATSPFWNIFTNMYLGLMTQDEAEELIRSKTDEDFFNKYGKFIIDTAGLYPFFIQLLAYYCYSEDDMNKALKIFQREAEKHYISMWEKISDSERNVIRTILKSDSATLSPQEETEKENLRLKGYLTEDYKIFSNSFRDFVNSLDKKMQSINNGYKSLETNKYKSAGDSRLFNIDEAEEDISLSEYEKEIIKELDEQEKLSVSQIAMSKLFRTQDVRKSLYDLEKKQIVKRVEDATQKYHDFTVEFFKLTEKGKKYV